MYIEQFTVEDVLVEEFLMDEQQNTMEREPYEVLHDFFVIFFFLHKIIDIYILIHF